MSERFETQQLIALTFHSRIEKVLDTRTGQTYVRKTLLRPDDPILRHQFFQEIEILSSSLSSHIPHIVDVEETCSSLSFVEQYIPGIDLNQWLDTKPSKAQRKKAALQLVDTIAALHEKGWLYIDHKPENILIFQNKLYVIDFNACVPSGTGTLYLASAPIEKKERYTESDDLALLLPILRSLMPRLKKNEPTLSRLRKDIGKQRMWPVPAFILSVFLLAGTLYAFPEQADPVEQYRNQKETLYSLLEKGKMNETLWSREDNTLFFIKETIRQDDPHLSRAVLKTMPEEVKEQYEDETLLLEWSAMEYGRLDQKSLSRQIEKAASPAAARLLLDICIQNGIYLSDIQQETLYERVQDVQPIVEYAMFLKSRNIEEQADIEPYLSGHEEEEYTKLWRELNS